MTEKRIITPDDPGFYTEQSQAPLVMGDAYEDGLIKRLAAKHQKDIPAIRYAASNIAHCPENWYKTAQLTGVNNIMTQPMWFSPIHTPQSWQTPSKRRESYAWARHFYECLAADTPILLENHKEIDIASIKPGMSVISGDGSAQKILNVFHRISHELILYVYLSDREQPLRVTKNHIIPRVLHDASTNEVEWVSAENLNTDSYLYLPSINGQPIQWKRVIKIEEKDYYGALYDLEIDNVHSYVANGIVVHNSEPKVAAAIDFYSRFPQNGFKLQYPEGTRAKSELLRKVLAFYEHHVVKKLKLAEKMKQMSSEYFMLGDVFVHCDIACEHCLGTAKDIETKQECDHHGGMINRLTIFNPDWIEVQQSPLSDDPVMVMIADEQVQQIVHKRQPKDLYDRIPDHIKELILSRKPIPLSNKTTFHLKHMGPPYASYGTSLVRRLFMTLAYKTKIMTANWIVAERLILPIRIAKVGSDERPATVADIADVQQQLAATANEPNLVIVTHNNFEMDFIGATGKILQVTQEMEHIDKEILDGMMLNQALLNGEAPSYSSAQVGVETLIRRIESWRNTLAEAIEDNVFKPLAEMQGFVDEERSDEVGEQVFLYPRIKWNDLELKDKNQWYQILMQLHDKQVISTQTLCEELDLNYDQEVRRMRYEQVAVGPAGGSLGGGGDMAGGMGMAGGGGGGGIGGAAGDASGASSPMSAGGAGIGLDGGGMGGPAGAGMGGAGGGAAAGGMGGGPTAGALGGKILKKGKAGKQDEQEPVPAVPVKLTQIEQDMARMLTDICHVMNINNQNVRIQYPCVNPKGGKPFLMDFAIPHLKLACECNGSYWHSQPQQIEHDKERDTLLAQRGWTVLRFDDQAIENAPHAVKETITSYIKKAMSHHKHASIDSSAPVTLFFSFMKGELQEISEHF